MLLPQCLFAQYKIKHIFSSNYAVLWDGNVSALVKIVENLNVWYARKKVWALSFHHLYFWSIRCLLNTLHYNMLECFHLVALWFSTRVNERWQIIRASSWENLSSGFATSVDSNRPAQPQMLGRGLKFQIQKLEVLYSLGSEQQRRWSDCMDAQADLRLCCSHMA